MDRIGTYASDQLNADLVIQLQAQLNDLVTELTSGKKSQDYADIAQVSQQALDLGDQNSSISGFLDDNTMVSLKLNTMQSTYSALQTTMSDFQQELETFIDNDQSSNAQDIQNLQTNAFDSLQEMEYYLNTQVDGQYLFSGTATSTPAVDIGFSTLSAFQNAYDGYNTSYPSSSAANLAQVQTTVQDTGSLTFNAEAGTITASNSGQFSSVPVGSVIDVTGAGSNSGTYTVLQNDGTTITVSPSLVASGSPGVTPASPITVTTSANATQDAGLDFQTNAYFTYPNQIVSQTTGGFSSLQAGDSFTISGAANSADDGNFIVQSVDPTGTTVTIQRANFTAAPTFITGSPDTQATIAWSEGTSDQSFTDATSGINFNANGTISDNGSNTGLSQIPLNSFITVSNAANPDNDGVYQVTGYDSTTGQLSVLKAQETSLNNEGANSGAQISNGTSAVITPGALTFEAGSSIALANNNGSLAALEDGQTVNITGTQFNNGMYQVIQTFATAVADETTPKADPVVNETDAAGGTTNIAQGSHIFNGSSATGATTFYQQSQVVVAGTDGAFAGYQTGLPADITGTTDNNGSSEVAQTFTDAVTDEANNTSAEITDGSENFLGTQTDGLTFTASGTTPTITATTAGSLDGIAAGDVITVGGTQHNNGTYVVTANNGTTLTLAPPNTAIQLATTTTPQFQTTNSLTGAVTDLDTATPVQFTSGSPPTLVGTEQDVGNLAEGDILNVTGSTSNNGNFVVTGTTQLVANETAGAGASLTDGSTTYANAATGDLQFFSGGGIVATTDGSLAGIQAGDDLTVAGTTSNDGTRLVTQIFTTPVVDETTSTTHPATLSINGTQTVTATNPLTFATNAGVSTVTGSFSELGGLQAGSALGVSGTTSNDGSFMVTATTPAFTDETDTTNAQATITDNTNTNTYEPTTGGTVQTGNLSFYGNSGVVVGTHLDSMQTISSGDSITIGGTTANAGNYTVNQVYNAAVTDEANNTSAEITDGQTNYTGTATGGLTFNASYVSPTITATNSGSLAGINPGDVITVSGSASNNASYVVTANNGTTLTLAPQGAAFSVDDTVTVAQPNTAVQVASTQVNLAPPNTAVQLATNASVSTTSYYDGNNAQLSQLIDTNTSLDYGVTASNSAFEQAIQAMGLIAEGQLGTAGGLDMNLGRVQQADNLMTSALNDLTQLQQSADNQQSNLSAVTTNQTNYRNFIQTSLGQMLNSDSTQTIVQLLDQQSVLEASYQALATVRQLSLLNYLK